MKNVFTAMTTNLPIIIPAMEVNELRQKNYCLLLKNSGSCSGIKKK
ncbi:MAG: hypothetical protein GX364_06215 [Firmicutes bacterium]|nr:hypothetical protein [Bacillota bacterium]